MSTCIRPSSAEARVCTQPCSRCVTCNGWFQNVLHERHIRHVDLVCLAYYTDLRGRVPRTSLEMHAFLLAVYLEGQDYEPSCRTAAHFQMYLLIMGWQRVALLPRIRRKLRSRTMDVAEKGYGGWRRCRGLGCRRSRFAVCLTLGLGDDELGVAGRVLESC